MQNLDRLGGLIHSQRVLLALVEAGLSREAAYALVQRNAMKVWEKGADFLSELLADQEVRAALPEGTLREIFDLGYHTQARRHDLPPRLRGVVTAAVENGTSTNRVMEKPRRRLVPHFSSA